jgi:Predicted membrane protein
LGLADIFALALALGADCFSVCLGLAMDPGTPRRALFLSLLFGGLQGGLMALGYQAATGIEWLLRWKLQPDLHWILAAAGTTVLLAVGISLISDFLAKGSLAREIRLLRGLPGIVLVGVSVNVDAFSAGVAMGMLDEIFLPGAVAVMSLVGSGLCRLGFEAGTKAGQKAGRIAQGLAGGLIVLVALKALAGLLAG